MKSIIVTLLVAGGLVGGYTLFPKVVPTLVARFSNKKLPSVNIAKDAGVPSVGISEERSGQVKGIMTKATEVFETLTKTGTSVGGTAIKIVGSTPGTEAEVIDVGKVVTQISDRVEAIPSHLVKEAKVEYCKKVIEEANKSPSPSPTTTPVP